MRMPWEDDINWGNIATTFGKENDMVTTDKVTVAEFAPHIGKTTTDYKENDMGVKDVLTQLEIIATNMVGRLAESKDERERKVISKQIEAIDMGKDALKTQIDLVRCKDCKHYGFKETDRGGFPCCTNVIGATPYRMPTDFCSYGERRADDNTIKADK